MLPITVDLAYSTFHVQYAEQMVRNGFVRPLELQYLSAEDLDRIEIRLLGKLTECKNKKLRANELGTGHRRVILHAAQLLSQELSQASPLPAAQVSSSPPRPTPQLKRLVSSPAHLESGISP